MRVSTVIQVKPASNVRVAVNAAAAMGYPLTHFVTINFTHTVCGASGAARAFSILRNARFNKWITRPTKQYAELAARPASAWVFENPDDVLHVHWIVHIPLGREQDFLERLSSWLERVTGGPFHANALHVRKVDSSSLAAIYMLKGAHEAYTGWSNIRHEPQGTVDGRRCGVSRSINRLARKRKGISGRRGSRR